MRAQPVTQLDLRWGQAVGARVLDAYLGQSLARAVFRDDASLAHRFVQESFGVDGRAPSPCLPPHEITTGPRSTAATSLSRCRPSQASTSSSVRTIVPRSIVRAWLPALRARGSFRRASAGAPARIDLGPPLLERVAIQSLRQLLIVGDIGRSGRLQPDLTQDRVFFVANSSPAHTGFAAEPVKRGAHNLASC